MKLIILLFAMCIGSGLALQDALSGLNYKQEVIYINQAGKPMPGPTAADASTPVDASTVAYCPSGKVTFGA
ncbi:hypothetical protein [Rufibacter latericius]|uniref:Uncharacterized protein n=1 Tax=Rufibacter latericius TaxID=2487040 RepID=A0A3M9MES8_9BACT|nr:hypothetical protein [Rufibacter latericius]RNI23627.1 hypothetical protein EFB08_19060 [Rufibacter latericius]